MEPNSTNLAGVNARESNGVSLDQEKRILNNFVTVADGKRIYFTNPNVEDFDIRDIAYQHARTCRFNCHIADWYWYSTAEHCVVGSVMMPTKELARQFLIHDATEYVFGDVPGPIKAHCPEYKKMEKYFGECLFTHYLGYPKLDPFIKTFDVRLCASEMIEIRGNPDYDCLGAPLDECPPFQVWPADVAYQEYIRRFHELFPEHECLSP